MEKLRHELDAHEHKVRDNWDRRRDLKMNVCRSQTFRRNSKQLGGALQTVIKLLDDVGVSVDRFNAVAVVRVTRERSFELTQPTALGSHDLLAAFLHACNCRICLMMDQCLFRSIRTITMWPEPKAISSRKLPPRSPTFYCIVPSFNPSTP